MTFYEHGAPCWIDMGTTDVAAAAAFYSGLFGWDIEIGTAEMGHYSNATLRGHRVAALADQQGPGLIVWATYLAVDDLDTTLASVQPAGGTIVMDAIDVMDLGRMAVVTDPGGVEFSLWQAGSHIGAGLVNESGTVCWNELATSAVEESLTFYDTVLGLRAEPVAFGDGDYYQLRAASGRVVAGLMPMLGEMWPEGLPNQWMVYFGVEDADATATRCGELGGVVAVAPCDIPTGRFAVLNDPLGGLFSIITPR